MVARLEPRPRVRREMDRAHRALHLPGHRRAETARLPLHAQDLTRQALLLGLEQLVVDQLLQPQADQLALLKVWSGLDDGCPSCRFETEPHD